MDFIISAGMGTHPCFFAFYNYDSKITNFSYTCQVKIPTLP